MVLIGLGVGYFLRKNIAEGKLNQAEQEAARIIANGCLLYTSACKGRTCAAPEPCENLNTNHDDYIALLRKLRKLKGVKKVFVRSGLRYDYVLADNNKDFVRELCEFHVSGQLKEMCIRDRLHA